MPAPGNTNFVVYENATGRILLAGECLAEDVSQMADTGQSALVTASLVDPDVSYISGGVVTARPTLSLSASYTSVIGTGVVTVSGLPNPTVVSFQDADTTVTDGSAEISSASIGKFTAEFAPPFPYQDASTEITFNG